MPTSPEGLNPQVKSLADQVAFRELILMIWFRVAFSAFPVKSLDYVLDWQRLSLVGRREAEALQDLSVRQRQLHHLSQNPATLAFTLKASLCAASLSTMSPVKKRTAGRTQLKSKEARRV